MFMAPSQVSENKFKARHSDDVAQCPVTGRICCSRDRCPVIREPLESLTLQRGQPPDQQRTVLLSRLEYQIGGILMLSGALGGSHVIECKFVDPLP